MPVLTGFLLSYLKFGESDVILHCFTKENGFETFFCRGIYSTKNRNRAYLLPLNQLSLTVAPTRKSGALANLSKLELIKTYERYGDIKANAIIFFVADFLNQSLKHESRQDNIFAEMLTFSEHLEQKNYRAHFIFLINILRIQGLLPLVSAEPYLDPESGNFFSEQVHNAFDSETSSLWKLIITGENPYELQIPSHNRKNLLESIFIYYQYHYADFRIPASLEIVQQIFE